MWLCCFWNSIKKFVLKYIIWYSIISFNKITFSPLIYVTQILANLSKKSRFPFKIFFTFIFHFIRCFINVFFPPFVNIVFVQHRFICCTKNKCVYGNYVQKVKQIAQQLFKVNAKMFKRQMSVRISCRPI